MIKTLTYNIIRFSIFLCLLLMFFCCSRNIEDKGLNRIDNDKLSFRLIAAKHFEYDFTTETPRDGYLRIYFSYENNTQDTFLMINRNNLFYIGMDSDTIYIETKANFNELYINPWCIDTIQLYTEKVNNILTIIENGSLYYFMKRADLDSIDNNLIKQLSNGIRIIEEEIIKKGSDFKVYQKNEFPKWYSEDIRQPTCK